MFATIDDNLIFRRRWCPDSRRFCALGVLGGETPSPHSSSFMQSAESALSADNIISSSSTYTPVSNSGINYAAANNVPISLSGGGSSAYQMPLASLASPAAAAYSGLASSWGSGSYGAFSSQAAATTITSSQAQVLSAIQSMGNASAGQPIPNLLGSSLGVSSEINFNNQETFTNTYSSGVNQGGQYQMTPGGLQPLRPDNGVAGFMWDASLYIPVAGPAMHAIGNAIQGQWGQAALNAAFTVADVTPFGEAGADETAKAAELAGERLAAESVGSPYAAGSQAEYDQLVAEAGQAYPNKAGVDEFHHITPRYLTSETAGPTVPIDAAYHQQITNAFRRLARYGEDYSSLSPAERQAIMQDVYGLYPLPPGTK